MEIQGGQKAKERPNERKAGSERSQQGRERDGLRWKTKSTLRNTEAARSRGGERK